MLAVYSLNPDKRLSVTIAIFFAEEALSVFARQHYCHIRSRAAIEAAKEWLVNPCQEASNAAREAGVSVVNASYYAASQSASFAAPHSPHSAAASAAANAAYASAFAGAKAASSYAAYAANAAATAYAASAAAGRRLYIHNKLVQLLPHIFEYKLHAKTSFKDSEQVFNLLSEENQERFLFSLNRLR